MKLLLDECIPWKLREQFAPHECRCVPEQGWAGQKNGDLLSLAERSGFDVFVTLDAGIEYQQNLQGRRIAIVLARSKSNRLADILPLVTEILRSMSAIRPGQIIKVGQAPL